MIVFRLVFLTPKWCKTMGVPQNKLPGNIPQQIFSLLRPSLGNKRWYTTRPSSRSFIIRVVDKMHVSIDVCITNSKCVREIPILHALKHCVKYEYNFYAIKIFDFKLVQIYIWPFETCWPTTTWQSLTECDPTCIVFNHRWFVIQNDYITLERQWMDCCTVQFADHFKRSLHHMHHFNFHTQETNCDPSEQNQNKLAEVLTKLLVL
jgi:hypothetical protein